MTIKQHTHKLDLTSSVPPLSSEETPIIRHAVVEASGVPTEKLAPGKLQKNIQDLNKAMDFHAVSDYTHRFEPQGISYLVVLEESHIAIHTWPEDEYIHLDIITCTKEDLDIVKLEATVKRIFEPSNLRILRLVY